MPARARPLPSTGTLALTSLRQGGSAADDAAGSRRGSRAGRDDLASRRCAHASAAAASLLAVRDVAGGDCGGWLPGTWTPLRGLLSWSASSRGDRPTSGKAGRWPRTVKDLGPRSTRTCAGRCSRALRRSLRSRSRPGAVWRPRCARRRTFERRRVGGHRNGDPGQRVLRLWSRPADVVLVTVVDAGVRVHAAQDDEPTSPSAGGLSKVRTACR